MEFVRRKFLTAYQIDHDELRRTVLVCRKDWVRTTEWLWPQIVQAIGSPAPPTRMKPRAQRKWRSNISNLIGEIVTRAGPTTMRVIWNFSRSLALLWLVRRSSSYTF